MESGFKLRQASKVKQCWASNSVSFHEVGAFVILPLKTLRLFSVLDAIYAMWGWFQIRKKWHNTASNFCFVDFLWPKHKCAQTVGQPLVNWLKTRLTDSSLLPYCKVWWKVTPKLCNPHLNFGITPDFFKPQACTYVRSIIGIMIGIHFMHIVSQHNWPFHHY